MRFYSLFIIFLCTSYCFSQQYEVRISDFDFFARTKKKRCGTNEMWLEIELINGSKHRIDGNGGETKKQSYYTPQRYDIPIKSIIFHSFIHGKAGLFCEGASASIDEKIPAKSCLKGFLERHTDGKRYGEPAYLDISFNYEISPVTVLTQTSYEIGYNDYLTLEIDNNSKNFSSELFKYEYILESNRNLNGWEDLPAEYQGRKNPKIRLRDFLPTSVIGDRIKIRTKSSCGGQYRSDFVLYDIKKSLPILTNPNNETIFTRCYGDKADYVLHFDRPLDSDEEINFSLVPNPNSDSLINIFQLERGNTFTLRNLPIGDYKLRITGKNGGNSFSKYGNEDFKFSIRNPSRVVFHTIGTAPSCANANNGEIKILAFGGTNQNYKIKLNEGEWLDFLGLHDHIIKNLPSGTYTIRVKDGNDCIGGNRGNEQVSITLTAPNPITITYPSQEQKRPQFPQATNGRIMAVVQGGTPYNGANRYRFSWKRGTEEITRLATTHYDEIEDKFYISLENIPQGDYYLSKL